VTGVVPCVSVVMPCFNEARTVRRAMERVLRSPYTLELIVVDDGSTDGSLTVARSVEDGRVVVLALGINQGKGYALRRGFGVARAPFVIVQDADLEYEPDEYPRLLGPLLDGRADVVFGSRVDRNGHDRQLSFWQGVGNRALTTASNLLSGCHLSDMETGHKAFRREVLESFRIEETRFGVEPEITAKVAALGWRIDEVAIPYTRRTLRRGEESHVERRPLGPLLRHPLLVADRRFHRGSPPSRFPPPSAGGA
jgi:glycosyltransferase involved in cell wall biosynthesis